MGDRADDGGQMVGGLFVNVNVKVNEDGGRLTFVDTCCRYKP